MRFLFFILLLSLKAGAASDPYMIESKVSSDLETALGRLLPKDSYIIQVHVEGGIQTERKLVEGESFSNGQEDEKPADEVTMMPGFVPEWMPTPAKKNTQQRQIYRMVENPIVKYISVNLTLDENLSKEIVQKAKVWVQGYLGHNYPDKSTLALSQFLMQPTNPAEKREKDFDKYEEKRKLASEPKAWWQEERPYLYGLMALVLIVLLFMALVSRRGDGKPSVANYMNPNNPFDPRSLLSNIRGRNPDARRPKKKKKDGGPSVKDSDFEPLISNDNLPFVERRKRFLKLLLQRSDSFRMYYMRINSEMKSELHALLRGPAYEKFLDGMGLVKPEGEPMDLPDMEERLIFHVKSFEDFIGAKEWQDKQFFGFLQRLTDEQLMAIAIHETPLSVAAMLRFMKSSQSAFILDSMPHVKRIEILTEGQRLQNAPFAEILAIEKELRESVDKLPNNFFNSAKDDIDYWKQVVNESQDQDALLDELEKTNPEIYPEVAKSRFKLDEARGLPPQLLKRVLAETDNEELGMAMLTLPEDLVEFFMAVISPKRKMLLEEQIASMRGNVPKTRMVESRLSLTKRFKEAMA